MYTLLAILSTTATLSLFFYGLSQIQIDRRIRRSNGQIARRVTVNNGESFYL